MIAPSCATSSCHSARAATAGLTLDDPDGAYRQLLDRGFVVPGDPASSLMALLLGDERRRMPPDAPLPRADIDLIRTWIEDGAPE
ncbi:MAG: c-type cytochrome domain-containing protein [Kofleriaceae bacterium]